MKFRAAIFDVYGTLLEVGPAPADAEARWQRLWKQMLQMEPRLGRLDFSVACSRLIAQWHKAARTRGIAYPEIYWPSIVTDVLPEVTRLSKEEQEDFILGQVSTGHTTRLSRETAEVLRRLQEDGCLLGIASNAQAYTLRELQAGLSEHHLSLAIFDTDLCFWSFQHGFSKPDPHVFQILSARLEARGISKTQTLAVGDRLDNDIQPARAHGWQTWHLSPASLGGNGGWKELLEALPERAQP